MVTAVRASRLLRMPLVALTILIATLSTAQGNQPIPAQALFAHRSFDFDSGLVAGGGGGQAEPSAYRIERFSRLSFYTALSSLGLGEHVSTNLSPWIDLRVFANYLSVNHGVTRSGFEVGGNGEFVNVGSFVDYYPFHRPFRISPGFLFYNGNRVRADIKAQQNASLTLNNIDFFSDNADPIRGTGRLTLGGSGFLITAGYGRIVSRSERHFSFPFEAGVVFINTPKATLNVAGQLCSETGINCQAAAAYPGFADALAEQLLKFNKQFAPFQVYPIIEGGVAYTFSIRGRTF
jgi:hypothetical protein